MKPKTGFESGSSPTLKVIRERITRAFDVIRVPVSQEPLPPQQHEFVYTEQHEERFQERAEKLTLAALSSSYISTNPRRVDVACWEISGPSQTAEQIIAEVLGK